MTNELLQKFAIVFHGCGIVSAYCMSVFACYVKEVNERASIDEKNRQVSIEFVQNVFPG